MRRTSPRTTRHFLRAQADRLCTRLCSVWHLGGQWSTACGQGQKRALSALYSGALLSSTRVLPIQLGASHSIAVGLSFFGCKVETVIGCIS